jgi:hypothetical protein
VMVGYMETGVNFFYGFRGFIGHASIDLVLSGLWASMRPGLISQSLCTDQIGLQYMITVYFNFEMFLYL